MGEKWLKAMAGALPNQVYTLRGRVVLGRSPDTDIQVDDQQVSRQHACVFERDDGQMMLIDLSSTNGTWLGDRNIREHKLKSGDLFSIGGSQFLYVEGSCPGEVDPRDEVADGSTLRTEEAAAGSDGLGHVSTVADVGSMIKMLRQRSLEPSEKNCGDPLHEKAVVYGWKFCPACGAELPTAEAGALRPEPTR